MFSVSVCRNCGKTIESKFLYCPWCGISMAAEEREDDIIENVFSMLSDAQQEVRRRHIMDMERQLDELENELSTLALSAEKGR